MLFGPQIKGCTSRKFICHCNLGSLILSDPTCSILLREIHRDRLEYQKKFFTLTCCNLCFARRKLTGKISPCSRLSFRLTDSYYYKINSFFVLLKFYSFLNIPWRVISDKLKASIMRNAKINNMACPFASSIISTAVKSRRRCNQECFNPSVGPQYTYTLYPIFHESNT